MQENEIVNAISRLKGVYVLQIRVLRDCKLSIRSLSEPVVTPACV